MNLKFGKKLDIGHVIHEAIEGNNGTDESTMANTFLKVEGSGLVIPLSGTRGTLGFDSH